MLILFDQGTPRPIAAYLKSHSVRTAAQQGWSTLSNGELLRAAEEAGFEAFLTTDKNLAFQQNLRGRKLAILVLANSQWPVLRMHIEVVIAAVNAATPGSCVVIEIPPG